jgi:hypothetical protein
LTGLEPAQPDTGKSVVSADPVEEEQQEREKKKGIAGFFQNLFGKKK